jgi:hypothetical protein
MNWEGQHTQHRVENLQVLSRIDAQARMLEQMCTQLRLAELPLDYAHVSDHGSSSVPMTSHGASRLEAHVARVPNTLTLQLSQSRRKTCPAPCFCSCHRPGSVRTPAIFKNVIGQLLVGYNAATIYPRSCNVSSCKNRREKSTFRIRYIFPYWLASRILIALISYSSRDGPELAELALPRVRSYDDAVFIAAQNGDVTELRRLFSRGLASPFDSSEMGGSLLYVSLTPENHIR